MNMDRLVDKLDEATAEVSAVALLLVAEAEALLVGDPFDRSSWQEREARLHEVDGLLVEIERSVGREELT